MKAQSAVKHTKCMRFIKVLLAWQATTSIKWQAITIEYIVH